MNPVTIIALLVCVTTVFSILNCMFSVMGWLQARDARTQSQENGMLLQRLTTQLSNVERIHTVEIDQPKDNPVPVVAVQQIKPSSSERPTQDRPER